MPDFEQITAGLADINALGDQIIAEHTQAQATQTDAAPNPADPFGAELLVAMDADTVAALGDACILSTGTKVDDSTVYGEELLIGLTDPGQTQPEEIHSIF